MTDFNSETAWQYYNSSDTNFKNLVDQIVNASRTEIQNDRVTLLDYLFHRPFGIPREQKLKFFEYLIRADSKIVLTGECSGVKKDSNGHKCLVWLKENLYGFIYHELGRVQ